MSKHWQKEDALKKKINRNTPSAYRLRSAAGTPEEGSSPPSQWPRLPGLQPPRLRLHQPAAEAHSASRQRALIFLRQSRVQMICFLARILQSTDHFFT